MENKVVESKDMIMFVEYILNQCDCHNTTIRVPERCNGQVITVEDLHEDNVPVVCHKYGYINDYDLIISLYKQNLIEKNNSGKWIGVFNYKIRYNGLESELTLEEFTDLYHSIAGKSIEIKEERKKYHEKTDMLIFNEILGYGK